MRRSGLGYFILLLTGLASMLVGLLIYSAGLSRFYPSMPAEESSLAKSVVRWSSWALGATMVTAMVAWALGRIRRAARW